MCQTPDGSLVKGESSADTFVKAIVEANPTKVRKLGLVYSGVPLISNTKDDKYNQKSIGEGWYVFTHTDTATKKRILERISTALNLGWQVEIVK